MKIIYSKSADKTLEKLDAQIREKIIHYLDEIALLDNPRLRGKALTGNLKGLWRYRVGDYRILCRILDDELVVTVVEIAHRREVYN